MSATTSTNIMPSIVFNCYLALLMQIRAVIAICFDLTGRQPFKITFYYVLPMLLLVSLRKKRAAKRLNVTNVTGLLLACFVRNSLICLKECEVWRKVFWNKIIVALVTQGLPPSFLSGPFAQVHYCCYWTHDKARRLRIVLLFANR